MFDTPRSLDSPVMKFTTPPMASEPQSAEPAPFTISIRSTPGSRSSSRLRLPFASRPR